MKTFIFITDEGHTFQPGSEAAEPDVDNLQVLGYAKGEDANQAFHNLITDQDWLLRTSFDEVRGIEINEGPTSFFYLDELRRHAIS